MSAFKPHFLVISLGNPLPKYSSLHSAGHFAIKGLQPLLHPTPWSYHRYPKEKCMVSHSPKYTLIQCPSLMNISGPFVKAAWLHMLQGSDPSHTSLVVIHDELEKDFGVVQSVAWDNSHHGHNGMRSVKSLLRQQRYPESPLVRIAVGIGRPEERDPDTVAAYVLSPIGKGQIDEFEGRVARDVKTTLEEIEKEWKQEFEKENQNQRQQPPPPQQKRTRL